jgi:hypothetical protein
LSPTVSLPEHAPRSTAAGSRGVRYGPRNTSRSVSNETTSAPVTVNQHSLNASRVEFRRWMNPSEYDARTTYWLYWRFSRSCWWLHSFASSAYENSEIVRGVVPVFVTSTDQCSNAWPCGTNVVISVWMPRWSDSNTEYPRPCRTRATYGSGPSSGVPTGCHDADHDAPSASSRR